MEALMISTLPQLKFLMISVWEGLVVPTNWLPKLIDAALAFT